MLQKRVAPRSSVYASTISRKGFHLRELGPLITVFARIEIHRWIAITVGHLERSTRYREQCAEWGG